MTIEQPSTLPPPVAPPAGKPGPVGLGGWLILPILGFIGTVLWTMWNLAQGLSEASGLMAILTATSGPLVEMRIPMILSVIGGVLVIASGCYCLFLVYSRGAAITKFATAHYLLLLAAGFVDLWLDQAIQHVATTPPDPSAVKEAVRGAVIAAIWIPYFQFSKRVRNTFTNTGASAPVAAE